MQKIQIKDNQTDSTDDCEITVSLIHLEKISTTNGH